MKIEKIRNEYVDEFYYKGIMDSGLEVIIYPKAEFVKKFVNITVGYGSFDSSYEMPDGELIHTPQGIAHYLEHQMFEDPEINFFKKFEEIGSSVNAYTSHYSTVYHCDTVNNLKESIYYLMNLVQNLNITDESVEKERGIIRQEILMYQDEPQWAVSNNLMKALMQYHPSREDIAGSVESISQIDTETIKDCYEKFYTPLNTKVLIFGDVNPDEMFEYVDGLQSEAFKSRRAEPKRYYRKEPMEIAEREMIERRKVVTAYFELGYKSVKPALNSIYEYNAALRIALDIIAGRSSRLFEEAYEKQYVKDVFSFDVQLDDDVSCIYFANDSNKVDECIELIRAAVEQFKQEGIDEKSFEQKKRKMVGKVISSYNSLQTIANNFTYQSTRKRDYFKQIEAYNNLTLDFVNQAYRYFFEGDYSAVSKLIVEE